MKTAGFYFFLFLTVMGWLGHFPVSASSKNTVGLPDAPLPGSSEKQVMTDIHDIRPLVSTGMEMNWWRYAGITVILVILAVAVWYFIKRRKKISEIQTVIPQLSPEDIANQRLSRISNIMNQDGRAFYFRLSSILRNYIQDRYDVAAPEMTTEEFLPRIDHLAIDGELKSRLKTFCRNTDPIKFAGDAAVEKQMEADLLFVKSFVLKTTPVLEKTTVPQAAGEETGMITT